MERVKVLAYGFLKLKPWEFDRLTIFDFLDMINAYNEAKKAERYDMAYWVANIVGPHVKGGVRVEALMKPFLKPQSKSARARESEEFFTEFMRERKEVEKRGQL